MSQPIARRLLVVGGGALLAAGCSSSADATSNRAGAGGSTFPGMKVGCDTPASGPGLTYCLVEKRELRVAGASQLPVGQVLLVNVDDNSAALLARDARGFYALSAICTHQCCLVAVCAGAACATLRTNPGACAVTEAAPLAAMGPAFLCPCHGSEFAADGSVISGPASVPLPGVAMRFDGADAVIDLSQPAASGDRVG